MPDPYRNADLIARLNAAAQAAATTTATTERTPPPALEPPFMACPRCRHTWKPKNPAKPPKSCPVCGSTRAKLYLGGENGDTRENAEI